MTLATNAFGPINRFRVQLVGDRLMNGPERTDMHEPTFGYLLVRIGNLDALRRMDSSGNALQAQEWLIPSWREDQFESVKRAVVEFAFLQFGGRPWTTCFHLVETSQRLGGTYRKVSLIEDVWPNPGGPGQPNASVDSSRIIDMVFDWGPNMDYGMWPVWLPAQLFVNLRARL
jgi:hypothetical protein